MSTKQLSLTINLAEDTRSSILSYRDTLISLLSEDLEFHNQSSGFSSHNFHSFPAKFPPQLPRKFIHALTSPDEVVFDPMMGSGTTVLEALLAGRRGLGFDIDPLALLITRVKVTPLNVDDVIAAAENILENAEKNLKNNYQLLSSKLQTRWDKKTTQFVDYWFDKQTQIELLSIIVEIERLTDSDLRSFFELAFSAIIITKSGGVSLALDLGHTRPHRVKTLKTETGEQSYANDSFSLSLKRQKILTKTRRSPLVEFAKRVQKNLDGLMISIPEDLRSSILFGDARQLPLRGNSVDLIVTSPPYASNAIDYMRAHKFSLVWMKYPVDELSSKRKEYIGGEVVNQAGLVHLPKNTAEIVKELFILDQTKGLVLHRYYSEMTLVLRELYHILKPGKAAIVVVGSSIMRGIDTETHNCLAEIGEAVGFDIPKIGVRNLDRDRRMMPVSSKQNTVSQIQQRMHQEYVIGFYKPTS